MHRVSLELVPGRDRKPKLPVINWPYSRCAVRQFSVSHTKCLAITLRAGRVYWWQLVSAVLNRRQYCTLWRGHIKGQSVL
jgi:hypothetical protein